MTSQAGWQRPIQPAAPHAPRFRCPEQLLMGEEGVRRIDRQVPATRQALGWSSWVSISQMMTERLRGDMTFPITLPEDKGILG